MEQVKVWVGRRRYLNGYEDADYKVVQFRGEKVGFWKEDLDEQGVRGFEFSIYRAENGTILIHRIQRPQWADEDEYGRLFEYASLEEAAEDGFRWILEDIGLLTPEE